MRNPLKRQPGAAPRKPLRERLDEAKARLIGTKVRAGKALACAKVVMQAQPEPPPVDRVALVNYATFLAFERKHVCGELYPQFGRHCTSFLLTLNAAERFFFPAGFGSGRKPKPGTKPPPASSRAVAVLDMVGVDWRADLNDSTRAHFESANSYTLKATNTPHGWPRADAALSEALDDLSRLDAAQEAMHDAALDESRDIYETPGYSELEAARSAALDRLASTPAESLVGLQAKARALQTPSVQGVAGPAESIAESLARDLIGAQPQSIEPQPDPILAVIDEARRLMKVWEKAHEIPRASGSTNPTRAETEAHDAFSDHCETVLLKTVPRTAGGCKALASYAVEFFNQNRFALDEQEADSSAHVRLLALIARSPLL